MKIQIHISDYSIAFEKFYVYIFDVKDKVIFQTYAFNPANLCRRLEKMSGQIEHSWDGDLDSGFDDFLDWDEYEDVYEDD